MRYRSAAALRPLSLLALAVAVLAAPGCRSATDAACTTESITATLASSNNVVPDGASASVRTVARPGGTLPSRTRVESITIRQADIQFTGTGTGTVAVALAINGYLATVGTLTISGGAVAGFTPSTSAPGEFGRDEARAIVAALPEAQRAALNLQNVDTLSDAQIRDAVSAAVRDVAFVAAVLSRTSGSAQGSVVIQRVTFGVVC